MEILRSIGKLLLGEGPRPSYYCNPDCPPELIEQVRIEALRNSPTARVRVTAITNPNSPEANGVINRW